MSTQLNPLSSFFRQPKTFVSLPSKGQYYPAAALDANENNSYPVRPMTSADALAFNVPAGLLSADAAAAIISSCVPAIKQPMKMPIIDLDSVMLSIYIASYGPVARLPFVCNNCDQESSVSVDLQHRLDQMHAADYTAPFETDTGLQVFFKPVTVAQLTDATSIEYPEQLLISLAAEESVSADKLEQMQHLLHSLTAATVDTIVNYIDRVVTPDGTAIVDQKFIREWVTDCDQNTVAALKDRIVKDRSSSEIAPVAAVCPTCNSENHVDLDLSTLAPEKE